MSVRSPAPGAVTYDVVSPLLCALLRTSAFGRCRLIASRCSASTVKGTASVTTNAPAGIVTEGDPSKRSGRLDPTTRAEPFLWNPTDAAPIVSGVSPNVFSSRTRISVPAMVDRAIRRTVAFVTVQVVGETLCMDEPQAATHCCAAAGAAPLRRSMVTPTVVSARRSNRPLTFVLGLMSHVSLGATNA
ncbi:MAG TPA: hypothetical protein EYQ83_15855 [Acidobacteria bacterium]|nr:hypothetical protein [Acidobacteriota bacterium]